MGTHRIRRFDPCYTQGLHLRLEQHGKAEGVDGEGIRPPALSSEARLCVYRTERVLEERDQREAVEDGINTMCDKLAALLMELQQRERK